MNKLVNALFAQARRQDPIQSHLAADRKNKSGTLSSDRKWVLFAVKTRPGKTAKQLDEIYSFKGIAHRRMKELESMGYVRREKNGREMKCFITLEGMKML